MSEQDQNNKKKQNVRVPLAGGTLVTAEIVGAMMHGGPLGVGAGLLAAAFVYAKGQDILDLGKSLLPESVQLPEWATGSGQGNGERSFMDRLFGHYPEEQEEQDQPHEDRPGERTEVEREDEEDDTDSLFAMEQQEVKLPCRRITIDEIVNHVNKNNLRNQYHVWLGRSVTREKNPVVHVNVYKKHLKVIGASQHGKSSMIACLLEQLCRTHDVGQVHIAILDLEDRTGKLFENDPHIVTFDMDGRMVKMHARTKEQTLEYLGYILDLMEWRYTLSVAECKVQPLLIVYIEEFQALKDHFKHLASGAKGGSQAKADYEALTYRISELARRGLKANIQLLLSVQVDYRDDDFVEALANITEGLCFGVKPTAAEAAGFTDARALKENYRTKIKGQAVAEFALVKDIVLAPDYDLDARLLAYEEQHVSMHSTSVPVKPFPLGSQDDQYSDDEPIEELQPKKPEEPRLTLVQKQQVRRATLGDAIEIINELGMMGRPNLQKELRARGLECSDDLARKLINDIKELAASVGAVGDAVVGD